MRDICAGAVTEAVAKLCIQANKELPPDIVRAMERAFADEPRPLIPRSRRLW